MCQPKGDRASASGMEVTARTASSRKRRPTSRNVSCWSGASLCMRPTAGRGRELTPSAILLGVEALGQRRVLRGHQREHPEATSEATGSWGCRSRFGRPEPEATVSARPVRAESRAGGSVPGRPWPGPWPLASSARRRVSPWVFTPSSLCMCLSFGPHFSFPKGHQPPLGSLLMISS